MTTPPYGETDPLGSTSDVSDTSTPIGDELAHDAGISTSQPAPSTGSGSDTGSAGDTAQDAKSKAQDALGSATDHASDVAGTAKEEAAKVASEAKDKATDLLADVKSQVDEQSKAQLQTLASKLGELADEIENLVNGSESKGTVTDVAQQLADRTHRLSSHLEGREPLDLLDDVRGLARRRPGAFLAGAAVAGLLAGRLTRGAKASHDSAPTTSSTPTATGTTVSDPPVVSTSTVGDGFLDTDLVPDGQNTGGRP